MLGSTLRSAFEGRGQISFIGVYDVFSATVVRRCFDGIFLSGFSFAASHYGLPDIGFIAWPDIVGFTRRLRSVLPDAHILVDMDDGYGDPEVAAHAAVSLEEAGASDAAGPHEGAHCLQPDCRRPFAGPKLDRVAGGRRVHGDLQHAVPVQRPGRDGPRPGGAFED